MRGAAARATAGSANSASAASRAKRRVTRHTGTKPRALRCDPRQTVVLRRVSSRTSAPGPGSVELAGDGLGVLLRGQLLGRVDGAEEVRAAVACGVDLEPGELDAAHGAPLGEVVLERAFLEIHVRTSGMGRRPASPEPTTADALSGPAAARWTRARRARSA